MKKFKVLFAVLAVLALATTAFAAGDEYDVSKLENDAAASSIGKISGTDPALDESPKVDGDYSAKVYYYGTIESGKTATVKVKLTDGDSSTGGDKTFYYSTTDDFDDTNSETANSSVATFDSIELDSTTDATLTFGAGDNDSSPTDWKENAAKAKLALTPTKVELKAVEDVQVKTGAAPAEIQLALDGTVVKLTTTNPFSVAPTVEITPDDSGLSTTAGQDGKITFSNTAKKVGTYTVSVKSGAGSTLTIDEAASGGATGIKVANFPTAATELVSFKINVVDLLVEPATATATWVIGASDDVVSFDVDAIAHANFNGISTDIDNSKFIITSNDKVTPDDSKSYVSNDVVISCDVTVGAKNVMVVSLDKTYLKGIADGYLASEGPYVLISHDVTFGVSTRDNKTAVFKVQFRRNADPVPPANAPERADADADNALLGVTSNDVADAATVNAYVSADVTGLALTSGPNGSTLVSTLAVVKAISDDNNIGIWGSKNGANITSLPIVSADLSTEVATLRFVKIAGSTLVSGDRTGNGVRRVSANDLNIIKLVASKDVTVLRRLGSVKDKKSADLDGKYNVYYDGKLVDTVTSASDDYELRVYIADNGKYDLAKSVNGKVVDPLAIVKSTGASHSSSSSCDMGFGAAALAGLAVLALRKRSK